MRWKNDRRFGFSMSTDKADNDNDNDDDRKCNVASWCLIVSLRAIMHFYFQ